MSDDWVPDVPDEYETRYVFVVNNLSQFLTYLRHVHLIATNHISRYLRGTVDYGIKSEASHNINIEGYVDSYWVVSAIGRALMGVALVWE